MICKPGNGQVCAGGGKHSGHPLTIHILGMNLPHTRDEPLGRNHPECQGKKGELVLATKYVVIIFI